MNLDPDILAVTAERATLLRRRRGSRRGDRSGAAVVELATIAPIMFTLFFASIEFSRASQIFNATSNAAYQGCRAAIVPGATAAAATAGAQAYLNAALITGATITVNPSSITNTTTTVTVTVSVPMNANTWIGQSFMAGKTVTRACTLTREKTN